MIGIQDCRPITVLRGSWVAAELSLGAALLAEFLSDSGRKPQSMLLARMLTQLSRWWSR